MRTFQFTEKIINIPLDVFECCILIHHGWCILQSAVPLIMDDKETAGQQEIQQKEKYICI